MGMRLRKGRPRTLSYIDRIARSRIKKERLLLAMSGEWKTRITKIQASKPQGSSEMACLVLIYPPGPDMGKRFPLDRNEFVLGRGTDCDIQVDRDSVSRRHARVFRNGDSWSV